MTLFELADLVGRAKDRTKEVIRIARRRGPCGSAHTRVLRALLSKTELRVSRPARARLHQRGNAAQAAGEGASLEPKGQGLKADGRACALFRNGPRRRAGTDRQNSPGPGSLAPGRR